MKNNEAPGWPLEEEPHQDELSGPTNPSDQEECADLTQETSEEAAAG
jgi:hypothetical protein